MYSDVLRGERQAQEEAEGDGKYTKNTRDYLHTKYENIHFSCRIVKYFISLL